MVFGCAPAAVAQEQSTSCEDAFLAVGGYPMANTVPAGWTSVYTPGGIFPWEASTYNVGQDVGAANFVAAADAHFAECPDTQLYAQGHSYGAGVVHVAAMTLNERPYANQVHVYVTGNPRHPGGVDDTWQGFTLLPGITFRGALPVPQNLGSFEDVCHPRDGICSMPPWWQPLKMLDHFIGYMTGAHSYPVRPAQPW